MFLVFKQKTAYEMRISDWSSDVCSSDLPKNAVVKVVDHLVATAYLGGEICVARGEGIKHVMHHFRGNLCHGRPQGGGLNAASLRHQWYALGTVLGIVTDAFDNAADLQFHDPLTQVIRQRCAQRLFLQGHFSYLSFPSTDL